LSLADTAPLRRELQAAFTDRPFTLAFWDGSEVAATEAGGPTLRLLSPKALAHVLRAPGELGMGRAYVAGLIEVDELNAALRMVDTFEPPPLSLRRQARLGLGLALRVRVGSCCPRARRARSCGCAASATPSPATGAPYATTTTSATSSSHCSWTCR